jgi:hypothetical protein
MKSNSVAWWANKTMLGSAPSGFACDDAVEDKERNVKVKRIVILEIERLVPEYFA